MKITEPGIYDMPMVNYHSDCCPGPSISSSGLRTIHNECPAEYWAFSYLNPNAFPPPDKQAFAFGRAAHCLILGDEDFNANYAVRPREWTNWRTNASQEWRAEQLDAGKTVITEADLTAITLMAGVLEKHALTSTLMEGEMEKSLIWQDEETGIWLKARPDIIPTFDNVVADFKTTTTAIRPYQIQKTISDFGYHQQMSLIAEGMEVLMDRDPAQMNFSFVFQMTRAPFHVTWCEISPEFLDLGRRQNKAALRTMADCLEKDDWPGYVDGVLEVHPPEWMLKQAETEMAA